MCSLLSLGCLTVYLHEIINAHLCSKVFLNKKINCLNRLAGWNMLFFLWGIFRGRRINHLDSTKKICIPSLNVMPNEKDFPTAVMTLSETQCSPKHMDKESIDQGHNMVSRNFDGKETIFDQTHLGLQVNLERQDTRINTKSTLGIPTISTQICQEVNSTGSSLVMFLSLNMLLDRFKSFCLPFDKDLLTFCQYCDLNFFCNN